jgi:Acyl-coenzyme A:6-aminopenicillanic acid acyl-transferase
LTCAVCSLLGLIDHDGGAEQAFLTVELGGELATVRGDGAEAAFRDVFGEVGGLARLQDFAVDLVYVNHGEPDAARYNITPRIETAADDSEGAREKRRPKGKKSMAPKSTGCFLIGVTGPGITAQGDALLGSVSDDPYDVRTFLRTVAPADALAHIGTELVSTSEHTLTQRGYFARPGETTRGINASGLAFTCAMVIEAETVKAAREATPYADLTERMMRRCRTVDEAIDLFEAARAIKPAYSVLLADADGRLAHLEVGTPVTGLDFLYQGL